MAHHTLTSEQYPDYTYDQSAVVWESKSDKSVCVLAVETPNFRGIERKGERKSVFLQFDRASAQSLLEELTRALNNIQ